MVFIFVPSPITKVPVPFLVNLFVGAAPGVDNALIVKLPLPLWLISILLESSRTAPTAPPIVKFPAAPEFTVTFDVICKFAAVPSFDAVAKRIFKFVSASTPKVIERIVRTAPKKEGNAVVELALAALKMRSVVLVKLGAELQLVEIPKFPEVAPVQVCAWSEPLWKLKAKRKAMAANDHGGRILFALRNFLSKAREDLPCQHLLIVRTVEQRFSSAKNTRFVVVLIAISNIVEKVFMGSEENEGLDIFPRGGC
jgi:hypothetical protein